MLETLKHRVCICACLLTFISAQAQQLPQHNEFQELGISFDVPAGWSAFVEGEAIIMGHQSIPGLIIMTENKSRNMAELKQLAQQGIAEQTIQLQPTGGFTEVGNNRLEGMYQGMFNGEGVKAFALAMIDGQGKGVNIISLTTASQFSLQNQNEAKKLAASVKFFQAVDSEATRVWKRKIVGRQLRYMRTSSSSDYSGGYTGSSDRTTINLCVDYRFIYASSSMASFDGSGGFGHAANQGSDQGTYEIYTVGEQSYLNLNFDNGQSREFELSTNQQGNTFLDGTRYFVTELGRCN